MTSGLSAGLGRTFRLLGFMGLRILCQTSCSLALSFSQRGTKPLPPVGNASLGLITVTYFTVTETDPDWSRAATRMHSRRNSSTVTWLHSSPPKSLLV